MQRDEDGLPLARATEHRLAGALVLVATVFFGLCACWGLFGPLLAGHYAASASLGIMAENMWQWEIFGPVWEYTASRPSPRMYYCHHPFGSYWTTALVMKLFGRHDFVCRLPAVLLSTAAPPLLFLLGRAIWRPLAGALAALAFVVLPITLSFAHFNALEVPVISWALLGSWGYVRYLRTQRRRHLCASLIGFVLALHADWPAYVLLAVLLAFGLAFGILWPKSFDRVRARPMTLWWVLSAT